MFETEEGARARGARALARVAFWTSWREPDGAPLADAPPPPDGACVLVGRVDAALGQKLRGTAWAKVPVRSLAPRAGDHEGAGGFAVAAAVAALARGSLPAALVFGSALGRGYALLLVTPGARG